MIKIVRNRGQVKALTGKSKYLLYGRDKRLGDMYALPGLKPIIGWVIAQIRDGGYRS